MRFRIMGLICLALLVLSSCNRKEGVGGTGAVQGYVKLINHPDDNFTLVSDTVDAVKTDVFIVYGNSDFYGDDVETDDKGFYKFKYLTKGTYTVFAYSTLPDGNKVPVTASVSIGDGGTGHVPTLYIHSGKAYGTSIVKGKIWARYINKNGYTIGQGWAYEHRVYIRNLGDSYHFDDTRVGLDGVFAFQKLQPGDYEVFTFEEDVNEIIYPLIDTVSVEEPGQIIEMVPDTTFVVRIKV